MNVTVYYSNKCRETAETIGLLFLVKKAAKKTLEYMNFPSDVELSVVFCSHEHIRSLNAKYRNKDASTDVLSFPLNDFRAGDAPDDDVTELGDIVINLERAREQAEEYGHAYETEVAFLAVHSTLHLLGIDHEISEDEDKFMQELQDAIMNELGLER